MTKGSSVDRIELHRYLWDKSDRMGRIEIFQTGLAKDLGVTKATMSLIIKDLVNAGRLRKLFAKQGNVGVYKVIDPALCDHPFTLDPGSILVQRCVVCGLLEDLGPHPRVVGR